MHNSTLSRYGGDSGKILRFSVVNNPAEELAAVTHVEVVPPYEWRTPLPCPSNSFSAYLYHLIQQDFIITNNIIKHLYRGNERKLKVIGHHILTSYYNIMILHAHLMVIL